MLAAAAAPAVVKSQNIMKLAVRKEGVLMVAEYEWRQEPIQIDVSLSDIVAETIRKRAPEIARNVSRNNALLNLMAARVAVAQKNFGELIIEDLFQNKNGFYGGYEIKNIE